MEITVTRTYDVRQCSDCPYFAPSMDGPYCEILEEKLGANRGYVYPEGRDKIPDFCPQWSTN
jgi:hypothetical protein